MNPLLGNQPPGSRSHAYQWPLDSDDDVSAIATRGSDPSDEDRFSSMANSMWTLHGNQSELCLGHVGSSFDDEHASFATGDGAVAAVYTATTHLDRQIVKLTCGNDAAAQKQVNGHMTTDDMRQSVEPFHDAEVDLADILSPPRPTTLVPADVLSSTPDITAHAYFLTSMPIANRLPVPPFELSYGRSTVDLVQDVQELSEYHPVFGMMPRAKGIDLGVQFTHMQHMTAALGVDAMSHEAQPSKHNEGQCQSVSDSSSANANSHPDLENPLHQIYATPETRCEGITGSTLAWDNITTFSQGSYPSESSSSYPRSSFEDDDLFSFTFSDVDIVSESDISMTLNGSFQGSARRDRQPVPGGISKGSPSDVRLQRRTSRKARAAQQHDPGLRHYCHACTEVPGGFLGHHELTRHQHAKHSAFRLVFICVEPADHSGIELQRLLQECDNCRTRKVYDRDYNAVAHLWRMHLNPVARGRRPRGELGRPGRSNAIAPGFTAMMVNLGWVRSILVDSAGREIVEENDFVTEPRVDLAIPVGDSERFETSFVDDHPLEGIQGQSLQRPEEADINDDLVGDLELFGPIVEL